MTRRRRQARAVAISETLDARRKAAAMKVFMVLAAMGAMVEALIATHSLWASAHP